MPNEETFEMQRLVDDTQEKINEIMTSYESGEIDESQFEDEMQMLLARGHMSSYMLGQESPDLENNDFETLAYTVAFQLGFLANFTNEMMAAGEFFAEWFARAKMYASAFNTSFWSGRTKEIPLPAMPGQGTQCYSNCRCKWNTVTIDKKNGDYDAYWILDPFVEEGRHCQTCLTRSEQWNPVLIRGGILQL